MKKNAILAFCILSQLLVSGCGTRSSNVATIRIGVINYRQTDVNGPPVRHAVRMAIDTINAAGGLEVGTQKYRIVLSEVTIEEPSEEQAVAGVQKLINQENVVAIVGPQNSEEAIAAGGLAEQAHIPMFCPIAADSKVTAGRSFVFRMGYREDIECKALAELATRTLKARTAAIFYQENVPYSRMQAEVFRREFTALGGKIVADETFVNAEEKNSVQLQRLRLAHPDVLLLPIYALNIKAVGVKVREAGIHAVFLGPGSWSGRLLRSVPEFDGSYMTTNWSRDFDEPENRSFIKDYERRFNEEPSETAVLTYDAFSLLFAAIKHEAKFDPASIQRGLYALAPVRGVSGPIDFITSGDPQKGLTILQFRSGRDTFYTRIFPKGQE